LKLHVTHDQLSLAHSPDCQQCLTAAPAVQNGEARAHMLKLHITHDQLSLVRQEALAEASSV
jgi:hypothetical protein